jgi:hypothetical protein
VASWHGRADGAIWELQELLDGLKPVDESRAILTLEVRSPLNADGLY